ncbi:alpha/beta hydrolase fold domain-containing protein [Massilia agilis]|uniref:Alpha/beta hydrolase fold domain-containing protein n=1 Tax=Massilia agilis TaxID=1811226 RepID=A0ABT2D9M1_9BURK|nr:alpha/beta hydrolase fold domain-containing protein [Massilia agilis]MCS0807997.1 alpha/beta hydrolase fold domain-containing protein [Massilia agilis]
MSATSSLPVTFKAIIVGAGFGGIGMAIALKKAGLDSFVILEKSQDVGGVWRDNAYPGAACDVPSHLYSFSFEPNPDWSRVFATQPEIHRYLQRCTDKYGLRSHLRLGAEVRQADYDEAQALWRVTLADGTRLRASILVTATGQLSRPVVPRIEGIERFAGPAFHSARWDHDAALEGKRVAVIGTGASAIQFVPALADKVGQLTVFQRSAAYIIPRGDRAYRGWEQAMFRRLPWTMRLHRAAIYLKYESRALAFTRMKPLLSLAVGLPFRRLLARHVPDAALRARLVPDYPIGCKRILLSNDYLAAMAKPNVELVTESIRRITPGGIETADGRHHAADAIVYGTGFAATEFLAPMRVTGRGGLDLHDAWKEGAAAYLGMTVPGFPNFFMLYGPNTNLGHNSILYMLESQIAHVMRCLDAAERAGGQAVEVEHARYSDFNSGIQRRLAKSVWAGCRSWYVDAAGHNSTNWPGFTLSYRWLAKRSGLQAYRFSRPLEGSADRAVIMPPQGRVERLNAGMVRLLLRTCFRPLVGPPWSARWQRLAVALLSPLMPGVRGVARLRRTVGTVPVEVVTPNGAAGEGAMLYLHGGAFCLGTPGTHRSVTTRLARQAHMPVWVPDYRLAPEHPYPAGLDDALACYDAMIAQGLAASRIVIAGDSAGGALALALALTLKARGEPMPAALVLVSPLTDPSASGSSLILKRAEDPMVRQGWLEQGLGWYACPRSAMPHHPLETDLRGLPPMLVQVGDQEILLSDSTRLAEHAAACGVPCRLEVHAGRWHVFHLSAFYLQSAVAALGRMADFARDCVLRVPERDGMRAIGGQQ